MEKLQKLWPDAFAREIIVWFMDPINHLSKSQEYGWDYLGKLFGEQLVWWFRFLWFAWEAKKLFEKFIAVETLPICPEGKTEIEQNKERLSDFWDSIGSSSYLAANMSYPSKGRMTQKVVQNMARLTLPSLIGSDQWNRKSLLE